MILRSNGIRSSFISRMYEGIANVIISRKVDLVENISQRERSNG